MFYVETYTVIITPTIIIIILFVIVVNALQSNAYDYWGTLQGTLTLYCNIIIGVQAYS